MRSHPKLILTLVKKDFQIDWRQKHPFTAILLYVVSTIFTVYMSFNALINSAVWNALYWIILLFIATMALGRSFLQEERRQLYYYFTVPPGVLILSKLIYSFLNLLLLGVLGLVVYTILMGYPSFSMGLFFLNFINGVLGLSIAFTLIASLAVRTQQKGNMIAVLGFPVILPTLLLAVRNSKSIVQGAVWSEINSNSLVLLAVNAIILSLTLILFPYSWKS